MKLWAAPLCKVRQTRRDFEGLNLMSESSSGAAPDSMLSFDDVSEDEQANAVEKRSLLLKSQSLDMPANNKVGVTPALLSSNNVTRNRNQTYKGHEGGVRNAGVQLSELSGNPSVVEYSPTCSNENIGNGSRTGLQSNGDATKQLFRKAVRACYFADGLRHIDYVLAYEEDEDEQPDPEVAAQPEGPQDAQALAVKKTEKRRVFESNLSRLGLELEHTEAEHSKTKFVLIHAPFEVLAKQAELLRVKMPVRQNDIKNTKILEGRINRFLKRFTFLDFDEKTKKRVKQPEYFSAPFIAQHLSSYINSDDKENFFPAAERSRMVFDLLIRTRYDAVQTEKYRIGVERLISNGTYTAAYPLHEFLGPARFSIKDYFCGSTVEAGELNDRQLLYHYWAKPRNFYKFQPLDLIKNYFGTKIGFYFAWLGYYTALLFPAALFGLICVIYGASTVSEDIPSNDICGSDGIGAQVLMCPVCDLFCDFTPLNTSCTYSKLTYVFDNWGTVFFAVFMSLWATLFLEGWKRYHADISWKWGVLDFEVEEETIRPEFQFRIQQKRVNPVTDEVEPYLPASQRILRLLGSAVTVIFFLCLVMAFVVGIIIYRTIVMQLFATMDDSYFQANAVLITSVTASSINLIVILILNYFYSWLALKLTSWECPRTQAEFDNSYTIKVFLFQFINYYSSLFYIAFFKERLSGIPGNRDRTHKLKIDGHRLEGCDPAGCMVELVIQLAITMCGKQFFSAFMEIFYPVMMNWFRRWKLRIPETRKQKDQRMRREKQLEMEKSSTGLVSRFEWDYALNPVYEQFLFDEYLEMVIQFGFVTLFVSAFPLAPLFALLNNISEIRLDAYKFTVTTRRPLAATARNLGVWTTILDGISKVAVLTNALVIAFTSDFIPKVLYAMNHSTLIGYVNASLSYFDAAGLTIKNSDFANVTVCRFKDYRKVPCTLSGTLLGNPADCDDQYGYSFQWWYVLAARLAFVLTFEHIVFVVMAFVAYVIPDIPTRIVVQLQRERFLARQARIAQDLASVTSTGNICESANSSASNLMNAHKLEKAFSRDIDEVAQQPDAFYDGSDPVPSQEMRHIMRNRPRPSLGSIRSVTSVPAEPSESRSQHNAGQEGPFASSQMLPGAKVDDGLKRTNSVESFYSCGNGNGSAVNLTKRED